MKLILRLIKSMFRTPLPLLVIGLIAGSGYLYDRFFDRIPEVKYVALTGILSDGQKQELYIMLADMNLKDIRLDTIKVQLKSVDWIADVNVQRQWPDNLVVDVRPEIALALWNQTEFINQVGRIYQSEHQQLKRLPQLYGPAGSEIQVINRYTEISRLMLRANRSIQSLKLDARGGWLVVDGDGVEVILGKDEITDRVQNMILVTAKIEHMGRLAQIQKIDTRYANGVAITWRDSVSLNGLVDGVQLVQNHNNQGEITL